MISVDIAVVHGTHGSFEKAQIACSTIHGMLPLIGSDLALARSWLIQIAPEKILRQDEINIFLRKRRVHLTSPFLAFIPLTFGTRGIPAGPERRSEYSRRGRLIRWSQCDFGNGDRLRTIVNTTAVVHFGCR